MSLRARIFIVISLGILIILGISLFLIYLSKNKTAAPGQPAEETAQTNLPSAGLTGEQLGNVVAPANPVGTPVKQLTSEEQDQLLVKQTAKIFIERYATYSTDNGYSNILNIQPLTTASLYAKLSAILTKPATGPFIGVTTQVFSSSVNRLTATSAETLLQASKTTEKGGTIIKSQTSYKVVLQKVNDTWLVDSFSEVK